MAMNQDLPATDSAAALREAIGEDSTATFENDPTFVGANPTANGSSENLQTPADRQDIQERPSIQARDTDDVDADEDDDDEDDDDEYEDVETEDEDEDEEDEDDLDDEDEDEDDLDDEDEDDEEEEDEK